MTSESISVLFLALPPVQPDDTVQSAATP